MHTFEAKAKIAELLDKVAAGETVLITRRGEAAALLVPPTPGCTKQSARTQRNPQILQNRQSGYRSADRRGSGLSFVVDCSVAARWLLPDEATSYTEAAFDLLATRNAVVPVLFLSEFANVFLKLSRQRKLIANQATGAVEQFARLGLEIDRQTPDP